MPEWSMTHAQYDLRLPPKLRDGCAGTFRVDDDSGTKGPVVVRCDACGQLLGVSRKMFDAGSPAPATEQMTVGGGIDTGEPF